MREVTRHPYLFPLIERKHEGRGRENGRKMEGKRGKELEMKVEEWRYWRKRNGGKALSEVRRENCNDVNVPK